MALSALMLCAMTSSFAETPSKVTRSSSSLTARTQAEVSNIAALIEALRAYASRSGGKYPAKIEELSQKGVLSAEELKKLTTSPLDGGAPGQDGYLYYFEGRTLDSAPTDVLVMGRNPLAPSDSRRAVGLQDGSVTWWRRAQVDAFLKAAKKPK